jgi:hypothetical protein
MSGHRKGKSDYLQLGDWNAVCYQCGAKFKASELRRHWQGYYVCDKHWEARHPQDFVRGVQDIQTPPWAQPVPGYAYVGPAGPVPNPSGGYYPIWVNGEGSTIPWANTLNVLVNWSF